MIWSGNRTSAGFSSSRVNPNVDDDGKGRFFLPASPKNVNESFLVILLLNLFYYIRYDKHSIWYYAKTTIRRYFPEMHLPGQACLLQGSSSARSPVQPSPPCAGAGFVHVRVLLFTPPPQSLLHFPKLLHVVNSPFTERDQHSKSSLCCVIQESAHYLYFFEVDWKSPSSSILLSNLELTRRDLNKKWVCKEGLETRSKYWGRTVNVLRSGTKILKRPW